MEDQKVAPFDNVAPTPAAPTQTDLPVITDPASYAEREDPAGPRGSSAALPDAPPPARRRRYHRRRPCRDRTPR
ncbi:hypothetical protein ACFQY7_02930 [Actinomadura luteofluorescens]|uniref:hypothetical protein n=1 Tax=Actinomadura luteofluorescens TaxID=46163 RepID=UPI00363364AC